MLGCWGIGASIQRLESSEFTRSLGLIKVEQGPFKKLSFPSAEEVRTRTSDLKWRLPPLARYTHDGIDFMPFILYDKITIDKEAFTWLIGDRPLIGEWKPSKQSVKILESLAVDGHIVLEDYVSKLDRPDLDDMINKMISFDLSDPNSLQPCAESLHLWIQFHKDVFGQNDHQLRNFHLMLSYVDSGNLDGAFDTFCYLYECVADINRVLVISQLLNQPIYEWEDYRQFYKYKFLRSGHVGEPHSAQHTFTELFNVFLPNFQITDYSQLLDIREDDRLNAVRTLANQPIDNPITQEFVLSAYEDVLRVNARIETFSKYSSYVGTALSLVVPSAIMNVLPLAVDSIAHKWMKRNIKWQTFFVDRAIEYKKKNIQDELRGRSR